MIRDYGWRQIGCIDGIDVAIIQGRGLKHVRGDQRQMSLQLSQDRVIRLLKLISL